jgi:hypothetical protein
MQVHERLLETYPSYRQNQARIDQFTERSIASGLAQRTTRRVITIPTVVHVVHKRASENITKAQIRSQISVLNRDFRAANPDKSKVPAAWQGLVGNANIKFALATKDPKGKRTDGITRTKTDRSSFGPDDSVKSVSSGGANPWPAKRYLNLWVCNLDDGLLGYAQFPGGPPRTDGVVILYSAFGTQGAARAPFNLGRSATHEIGHWLNLRHIWGDTMDCTSGDRIPDTPNAAGPNFGKPTFPHITCNNGPNGDMFMNYMDYVDDAAMVMFSDGQVTRMNAALAGPRSSFA